MEKGVPIRSISRCISVLQAINRVGPCNIMQISAEADVPYSTACRIVQTLLFEGLIEREPARPRYRATALVQSLSQGFQNCDALVAASRPHIVDLTKEFLWPVAVTTHVGQHMVVRDSTHTLTPMTFNHYYPGYTLPIIGSAAGRAFLAFAPEAQRRQLMSSLRDTPQYDDDAVLLMESGALFKDIRERGYATKVRNRYIECPGKTSSLAAPILINDCVAGVLIMSYFTSSMSLSEAERQLARPLMEAGSAIAATLAGTSAAEWRELEPFEEWRTAS